MLSVKIRDAYTVRTALQQLPPTLDGIDPITVLRTAAPLCAAQHLFVTENLPSEYWEWLDPTVRFQVMDAFRLLNEAAEHVLTQAGMDRPDWDFYGAQTLGQAILHESSDLARLVASGAEAGVSAEAALTLARAAVKALIALETPFRYATVDHERAALLEENIKEGLAGLSRLSGARKASSAIQEDASVR